MASKPASRNRPKTRTQIDDLLVELAHRYEDSFDQHQWPWETQRWHELVYCLLAGIEGRFALDSRAGSAMPVLGELGLLDLPSLARKEDTTVESLTTVLQRLGFSKEQIKSFISALCELAKTLQDRFQGMPQLLLRQLGTDMVERVRSALQMDRTLDKQTGSIVITHWLQNVLNIPVMAPSPGVTAFMADTGATADEVLSAADRLDINAALIDDILNRWAGVRASDARSASKRR